MQDQTSNKLERWIWLVLALCLLGAAAAPRFLALDHRPMHGDEAVNTFKFAQLWTGYRGGSYRYDPHEYHGPTLPYLTLPMAWTSSAENYGQTDEAFYRRLTALAGLALVAITLACAGAVGRPAALLGAALVAVSPAMIFYSRFYIHEMFLVLFTAAAMVTAWRGLCAQLSGRSAWGWAATFGAMLAGMHATKETFVIAGFAACAAIGALVWRSRGTEAWRQVRERACALGPMLLALGVMAVVSITLFTCFFSDASGPWHSVTTYGKYLDRGAGGEARHVHPWYWYGWMLAWYQPKPGPWFSEAPALVLGLIGALASFTGWGIAERHRPAALFVATYTLVLAVCYSVIPYKTPWCLLGFWHGMLLLAGIGSAAMWQIGRHPAVRAVVVLCVLASFVFLGWMADRVNRTFDADPRNPYVYAHPLRSVTRFEQRVAQVAAVHPDGWAMPVKIFEKGNNWPIPFYLRRLERYGAWQSVEATESPDAAMIFVDPDLQDDVDAVRKGEYHIEYLSLRPREVRAVYVRQDLWDAITSQSQP